MKTERAGTTELEHSFTQFLQPIWAVVWYRICCWQIYNCYTLCSCAALQATVPLSASFWFSLSARSRTLEYLQSYSKSKYITQRNFNACFKFNFLLSNNTNLSKDIKAWRLSLLPFTAVITTTAAAVWTSTSTSILTVSALTLWQQLYSSKMSVTVANSPDECCSNSSVFYSHD